MDKVGACCDSQLDACGICNGTAVYVDAQNSCCAGALDAAGRCCLGVVDECGVCNGKCNFLINLSQRISISFLKEKHWVRKRNFITERLVHSILR